MTNYKLSGDDKGESLVVVYEDADPVTVPGTHPKFDDILALLRSGGATDDAVQNLVNTLLVVGKKLAVLSDRVSVASYGVFFDGDPLRSELADVLLELLEEGKEEDLVAVAKFLENAAANNSMDSVDAMYRWITNGDLAITPEGMFLAYKGVRVGKDGVSESITRGKALVDGEAFEGNIPNPDGAVITMPRTEVTADSAVGCGPGLHAGTHSYAKGFAQGRLLLVEINPRDVVSVPSDSSFQKLRVSRYKVIEHIEHRLTTRVYDYNASDDTEPDTEWDDYEDYDEAEDEEFWGDDDGDFTEEGPVDEQDEPDTESLKDELEKAFAGDTEEKPGTLEVDGSIEAEKLEEPKQQEKPSETPIQKFKHWFLG
jgi:hypothetical protein